MKYALLLHAGGRPPGHTAATGVVWLKDPETATTIVVDRGERVVLDSPATGPLAGWLLVDCPDLDVAIVQAGRLAEAVSGTVEIRPVRE